MSLAAIRLKNWFSYTPFYDSRYCRRAYSEQSGSLKGIWKRAVRQLEAFEWTKVAEINRLVTQKSLEVGLEHVFKRPFNRKSSLEDLTKELVNVLVDLLKKEEKKDEKPLTIVLRSLGLTVDHFSYNEEQFESQEFPNYPVLLQTVVNLISHPFFLRNIQNQWLPQHEESKLINYADYYWMQRKATEGIPIIIKPEQNSNLEDRLFNSFAYHALRSEGTFVREHGAGSGHRVFNLLHFSLTEKNRPKIPAAFYGSEINVRSAIIGKLAISSAGLEHLPVSFGTGHLLGRFVYPNVTFQDQVSLLSRVFTVCDSAFIDAGIRHLNKSLRIGDRVVFSSAPPYGRLYNHFKTLEGQGIRSIEMGYGLKGETFVETHDLPLPTHNYLNQFFAQNGVNKWHPEITLHTFFDPYKNRRFFEERGFAITNSIYLEESKFPETNPDRNDRAFIELTKRQDI